MKISQFSASELAGALRRGELLLTISPFVVRIKTDVTSLAEDISVMYSDFHVCRFDAFADFHVEIARETGLRRWFKPQVRFFFDGRPSFVPLPISQSFAMLEWGVNWCVASHCHQYLIIHAAVIEKDGQSVVLPAPPGSGKSTLCAGLVMRGWRLLSDELALYDMDSGLIYGMSRPINLKNKSIDVIKQFAPDAIMTAPMTDTTKGTVALLRPPLHSVLRAHEPGKPTWIILPKYSPHAAPELVSHSRAHTFMLIADQSFNYSILGVRGFDGVGRLVDECQCYQFTYSQLDDAVMVFHELLAGKAV